MKKSLYLCYVFWLIIFGFLSYAKSSDNEAKKYTKPQRYEKLLKSTKSKKQKSSKQKYSKEKSSVHIFALRDFAFFAPLTQEKQITSWSEMRDKNLTKQEYDYSCGAASLSSILEHYYGVKNASEKEILDFVLLSKGIDINQKEAIQLDDEMKQKAHLSFYDMVEYVESRGFKAFGLSVDLPALSALKAPVIIYVKVRNIEHFSVLKGIDSRFVYLADPSFGNIKVSIAKFVEMFYPKKTRQEKRQEKIEAKKLHKAQMQTQKDALKNPHNKDLNNIDSIQTTESINRAMRGKIMAIVPKENIENSATINTDFTNLEKHSNFVYESIKDMLLFKQ